MTPALCRRDDSDLMEESELVTETPCIVSHFVEDNEMIGRDNGQVLSGQISGWH